jgi:hypothetical protein
MISFIGCGKTVASPTDSKSSTPSTTSIQAPNAIVTASAPFTLADTSSYFCPFVFNGTDLIFPNPNENNRISTIPDPLPADILQSKNITDFADYSADNITLIDKTIYFADSSNNNALCSLDITSKTYTKLNTHSIHNLITINNELFYMNKNDDNKIYKYDTTASKGMLISTDSVGSFIINGDFIIYQNLSDTKRR